MSTPLTSPAAPSDRNAYRSMLRQADELEAKLDRMTGDEDNFFSLQRNLGAMETAMCEYSQKVNGYYNHRFAPLSR